jgi:hypothetical protein
LEKWKTLSPDEKRAGLAADGVDAFLQSYVLDDWRAALAAKIAAPIKRADSGKLAEIAQLARVCRAYMNHPEQHVDDLRKNLSRIVNLTGEPKQPVTEPPAELNGNKYATAFERIVASNQVPADASGDERKAENAERFAIPEDLAIPEFMRRH